MCVTQSAAMLALDLPKWVVLLLMIAPIWLLIDCVGVWVRGGSAQ